MQQVNTRYYAEQIAARYPDLPQEVVQELCLYAMRQLYVILAMKRFDVSICDKNRNLKLKFYKRDHNVKRANSRARMKAKKLKLLRKAQAESTQIKKHF